MGEQRCSKQEAGKMARQLNWVAQFPKQPMLKILGRSPTKINRCGEIGAMKSYRYAVPGERRDNGSLIA